MTSIDSRLPDLRRNPFDWSPLGGLVMRPWYDRCALHLVARWYLPLSRAWAAALANGGDEAGFARAAGLASFPGGLVGRSLQGAIARTLRRHDRHKAADGHWLATYFASRVPGDRDLVEAEQQRIDTASSLMTARMGFLMARRRIPAVRWQVRGPDHLDLPEIGHGDAGTCISLPVPPDCALPAVEESHPVLGPYGREYWLRFASPGGTGDTAWARVFEPEGVDNPPTLISLHGIGMEVDDWRDAVDSAPTLTRRGLRVIRPQGPWHGRRRIAGSYGGEPAMALGPEGFIKLFAGWGAEVGVLVDWARRNGSARVALGGVSLGALTSQLTAVAATAWPESMRPDCLLLVATSGDLLGVATAGSLSAAVGYPEALARAGWTQADLERCLPLAEPRGPTAMPAQRIVVVLGEADTVTPFAGGLALARRWGVPPENLFIRRQGHFSVSLDLCRQPQPFDRLVALLNSD